MKRTILVAVALVALTGCLPQFPAFQGAGPTVAVMGDSITEQAERHRMGVTGVQMLTDDLVAANHQATVSALIGASTDDLTGVAPLTVDVNVVALGTNDLRVNYDPARLTQSIVNVGGRFALSDCDVFIGVREEPTWGLDVTAHPYNDAMAAMADVFVDWDAIVDVHPEYVLADDVHLTDAGKTAYRDAIVDAVNACPTKDTP